jgi:hypothetical protein
VSHVYFLSLCVCHSFSAEVNEDIELELEPNDEIAGIKTCD